MRMTVVSGRWAALRHVWSRIDSPCGSAAFAAPQMLLVNAKVFTADPALPYAQAVAIEGGRIRAVGSNEQMRKLAGPDTRVIDAGGRLVTPGLTEAHVHLAVDLPTPPMAMPNLPFPGPTAEQALAAVEQAAKTRKDWITGYIGPLIARDRRNWRKALDAVAPKTPVFLRGFLGTHQHRQQRGSSPARHFRRDHRSARRLVGPRRKRRLDGRAYEAAETIAPRIRPATAGESRISLGEAHNAMRAGESRRFT